MDRFAHFLHPRHWHIELLFLAGVVSTVLGVTGAYWDIGWHFDYGRDTFWSPPHLMIYGSLALTTFFFLLNVVIGMAHGMRHRAHALFLLFMFGVGGVFLTYLSAPFDELWHRRYGIDVQIVSFPHLMLIFGGILGTAAILGIARYHALHERRKFLLEKVLVPFFLAAILAGLILILAESEFPTLPEGHPVQSRPPWVYPTLGIAFGTAMFFAVKQLSALPWGATLVCLFFFLIRLIPIGYNSALGMASVPVFPPFAAVLLAVAVLLDAAFLPKRGL